MAGNRLRAPSRERRGAQIVTTGAGETDGRGETVATTMLFHAGGTEPYIRELLNRMGLRFSMISLVEDLRRSGDMDTE